MGANSYRDSEEETFKQIRSMNRGGNVKTFLPWYTGKILKCSHLLGYALVLVAF